MENIDLIETVKTAKAIAKIEDSVYNKHKLTSRPFGRLHSLLISEIAVRIAKREKLMENLDESVIEILTDWNFHTAAIAAKFVLDNDYTK